MLEHEIPPESIDLWPQVQTSLVSRLQTTNKSGAHLMNHKHVISSRIKAITATGVFLVGMAIFMIATPQGRVLAQEIIQFFTRQQINQIRIPTSEADLEPQPENVVAASDNQPDQDVGCSTILNTGCTIDLLAESVSFGFYLPNEIADMLKFSRAAYGYNSVVLEYTGLKGTLILLENTVETDDPKMWMVGEEAELQAVAIDNRPAEYVEGWWGSDVLQNASIAWDKNLPTRTLRWEKDAVRYTLINLPAQSANGAVGFEMNELIQLAGNLTPIHDVMSQPHASERITISEAEQKAGFKWVEPVWLPNGYTPDKTNYNSEYHAICQYYRYHADDYYPALILGQSDWELPGLKDLLAQPTYDGKPVEMALTQMNLGIKGANGNTGVFLETGILADRYCGGETSPANRALLWQSNQRTFVLFGQLDAWDGRGFITLSEMVKVAEGVNGTEISDNGLDPERLLSRMDAESLSGLDILLPGMMLDNLRFDHVSYSKSDEGEVIVRSMYSGPLLGDGRTIHIQVIQEPDCTITLEEVKLGGGYQDVTIRGQPGVIKASCWQSVDLEPINQCNQEVVWYENGTRFSLDILTDRLIPEQTLFTISESFK